jgi:hypothetical protein
MRSVLSALRLEKVASRRLGWAATLLGVSAAFHVVALLVTGGNWEGAVSFRKPITFGISVGLLLWTCGWVMDRLPARKRLEGVLTAVLIGSGLIEVGLITTQAWREAKVTPRSKPLRPLVGRRCRISIACSTCFREAPNEALCPAFFH